MAALSDGRISLKFAGWAPVSNQTDYPEAEATVPIHPETPTSGHNYLCILLAKGAITAKYNKRQYVTVLMQVVLGPRSSVSRRGGVVEFQIL
jgi:hypothetical protein